MATFEQRQSGYWQAKIRRKGWPTQSRTFRIKVDAEAWARSVETNMDKGIYQSLDEAEETTLKEIIDRFINEYAPRHYRHRDDEKEAWRFQCSRLKDAIGVYSLAAIDQKLVAKYRDERLTPPSGSKLKAVGESTVRKELYMLSKIFGFIETECGINLPRGNPVTKIRKPSEGKARERRLSIDEWKKLEEQCLRSRNKSLHPALILAVETAMRQGEMLGLHWENVDFQRNIAMLSETKNGEARTVPLTTRVVDILKSLPQQTSGLVLQVERQTLYHAFEAACKRAGIDDYTWHDLRHEALSRLAERGDMTVLELAEVSGHKTIQMLKRYTHLQAEKLAKKLNKSPAEPSTLPLQIDANAMAQLEALASKAGLSAAEILSKLLNGDLDIQT